MQQANSAPFSVRKIRPSFVGEVSSLDLRRDLSDDEISSIARLIHEYGVLIVRGQNNLSDDDLLRFARRFGGLFVVGAPGKEKKPIIRIGNLDEEGNIQPAGHMYRAVNAANALWHIDNTYSEPPAKYSMLLGRIVPSSGGETEFADASAAYDALSDEMKERLKGRTAIHSLLHSRSLTGFAFSDEERRGLPERERSFIIEHPDTGRKAIGVASHVRVISGMTEAETRELLDELLEHTTQQKYLYRHEWTPGDLLIYDNRMVLHRAQPYPDMTEPRDLSALRVE
jgi:alpha-ketoglutarate-dependent 2,4-dichlorophenoxyacetate dioxygenase